jgi:tRNA (guanine37-N1)-methyltransferase
VNKTHGINTTFRTFAMEVIAGQECLDTEVSESRCRFAFNYGQVYWNSRLQHEHERLLKKLKPSDIVCDMFAGVGPSAVPAAKNTGCKVYANDLNPKSYEALVNNALRNKVQQLVRAHNMDARDFVRALYKETPPVPFTQVIMNLPASAECFLDVFREFPSDLSPPTIHCYVFTKDTIDPRADVVKRIESVLQCALEEKEVYEVRDVSPKKLMMCVSFPLPRAAYSRPGSGGEEIEHEHEHEEEEGDVGRGAKRKEPDVSVCALAPAREEPSTSTADSKAAPCTKKPKA